jgi:hypothetical protein
VGIGPNPQSPIPNPLIKNIIKLLFSFDLLNILILNLTNSLFLIIMAHQYASSEPKTGFNLKYEKVVSEIPEEFDKKKLQYNVVPRENAILSPDIYEYLNKNKPNQSFTQAYNQRVLEEEKNLKEELNKEKYDSNGNLLASYYTDENFKRIHDPLNIYKKKGNYDDLNWRVFRDVDDSNIFLKVLYFPKITYEDYNSLLVLYRNQNVNYNNRKRLTNLSILGAGLAGWVLSYRMRFKFVGFLLTTSGLFFGTKFILDRINSNSFKNSLNSSAILIANKYPAIKFSTISHVKGKDVNLA